MESGDQFYGDDITSGPGVDDDDEARREFESIAGEEPAIAELLRARGFVAPRVAPERTSPHTRSAGRRGVR